MGCSDKQLVSWAILGSICRRHEETARSDHHPPFSASFYDGMDQALPFQDTPSNHFLQPLQPSSWWRLARLRIKTDSRPSLARHYARISRLCASIPDGCLTNQYHPARSLWLSQGAYDHCYARRLPLVKTANLEALSEGANVPAGVNVIGYKDLTSLVVLASAS